MKTLSFCFGLFCTMSVPVMAVAEPRISGTFTGTAVHTVTNATGMHPGTIDGSPVTGSFTTVLAGCYGPNPAIGFCLQTAGGMSLTMTVAGQSLVFAGVPSSIEVTNTSSSQFLDMNFYTGPYTEASLDLAGMPDAFVTGLDLTTMHAGTVEPASSSLNFFASRDLVGDVAIGSITLSDVPEPASWTILGISILLAAASRRASGRQIVAS